VVLAHSPAAAGPACRPATLPGPESQLVTVEIMGGNTTKPDAAGSLWRTTPGLSSEATAFAARPTSVSFFHHSMSTFTEFPTFSAFG
jgi:hypothetical protein